MQPSPTRASRLHPSLPTASYGRWIAGIYAHAKGKNLGMYEETQRTEEERKEQEERDERMGVQKVYLNLGPSPCCPPSTTSYPCIACAACA